MCLQKEGALSTHLRANWVNHQVPPAFQVEVLANRSSSSCAVSHSGFVSQLIELTDK